MLSGCPKLSLRAVSLPNPTSLAWPDHIHRGDVGSDTVAQGFPGGREVKNPPANAGDAVLIPGSGRSPGEGNGNPLQYPCQEMPWTEEPGGRQSMESQRVDHKRVTKQLDLLG